MPSPTQITVSQLARRIGLPDSPTIVDVCIDEDFKLDPRLIPSSVRHPHSSICSRAESLRGKHVVLVCQKGLKLSQGAAAMLRAQGIATETLQGGIFAWRDAGEPLVPVSMIPDTNEAGQTVWVTRHRPKIDRIACPWLIRRFIDPGAVFLFVEPSQVLNVAEKFNATPFDMEGVHFSHRGDNCSFDAMLEDFELRTEPLLRLAEIVRGADTNRHDLAPQAAGLMAASLGLSRMYKDDVAQLEAGLNLYDMYYRWARDAVNESHDWPTGTTKS